MANILDRSAFAGETLTGAFSVSESATAVKLLLTDNAGKQESANATKETDGLWHVSIAPQNLSGPVRWYLQVFDPIGMGVEGNGEIYIRPLTSKYREVVAAIEDALKNWGNNPNRSISVGEISITYKDHAELLSLLSYFRSKAEADEKGITATTGPRRIRGGF